MKFWVVFLLADVALGVSLNENEMQKWVDNNIEIAQFVEQNRAEFGRIVAGINQTYVQLMFDFCDGNNDMIVTRKEHGLCEDKLAAIYGMSEESAEVRDRLRKEAVFNRLAKGNPSGNFTIQQFGGYCAFEVLSLVNYRYLDHDANNDKFMDKSEMMDSWFAIKREMSVWSSRLPKIVASYNKYASDYQKMWYTADKDGDYETATFDELMEFTTQSNIHGFRHLVLDAEV